MKVRSGISIIAVALSASLPACSSPADGSNGSGALAQTSPGRGGSDAGTRATRAWDAGGAESGPPAESGEETGGGTDAGLGDGNPVCHPPPEATANPDCESCLCQQCPEAAAGCDSECWAIVECVATTCLPIPSIYCEIPCYSKTLSVDVQDPTVTSTFNIDSCARTICRAECFPDATPLPDGATTPLPGTPGAACTRDAATCG